MTLTNGQDLSAEIRREQKRQGLEPVRATSPRVFVEAATLAPLRLGISTGESRRRLMLHDLTLLEAPTGWSVGTVLRPEIASRSQSAHLLSRARKKLTGLAEGYKNVCERWSLDALSMAKLLHLEEEIGFSDLILSGQVPPVTGDLKDRMALVIGISLGLGEFFDDDKDAEVQWLNAPRDELGCISSIAHMLEGDPLNIRDVADLVDSARGLK